MKRFVVASFTDAWIETPLTDCQNCFGTSHLLQMRGLKLIVYRIPSIQHRSHLLQMRGLKLLYRLYFCTRGTSHLLQMRGLKQKEIW